MDQDESEHGTVVAVEMREEKMGDGEEKMEMAVEAVVVTAQQTATSDEKDGVESAVMEKRAKESDEEGKREEEDVEGETWQMVQAKRQKLAAKKKKAKERKAKGKSVSASGEEKKAEVEASQSVMSARELVVDGSDDDLILSDEEERRRLWTLSQLALSQADIDRAVVRPDEAHPALLTMLDVIHRLIDRWMAQCSSALTPNSNPFTDRQYASDWRCAVVRLCLSPTRFTNRCLSTALHSVPFPANFVLKTS
jgi:hypothetical protein